MPTEAQNIYFHMLTEADDDGIVESYPLIKMLGLPPDNMKILFARGFIKPINNDEVIVITDWLEHNTIRPDRKRNSIYLPLMTKMYPELPFIEAKPRSDVNDNSNRVGGLSTVSVSKDKIRQDKLSKDKIYIHDIDIESVSEISNEISSPTPKMKTIAFFTGVKNLIEKKESPEIKAFLIELSAKIPKETLWREIQKFYFYWTELNGSGKKQRWEMQKTFEVNRRLANWIRNTNNFKKVEKDNKYKVGTV